MTWPQSGAQRISPSTPFLSPRARGFCLGPPTARPPDSVGTPGPRGPLETTPRAKGGRRQAVGALASVGARRWEQTAGSVVCSKMNRTQRTCQRANKNKHWARKMKLRFAQPLSQTVLINEASRPMAKINSTQRAEHVKYAKWQAFQPTWE